MSVLDALFNRLGRPAGRALDPTIRDIVHAVLKEHGYASPAEVQALRDEVRDTRGRVDGMQRRLDDVVRQADEVRVQSAQSVSSSRQSDGMAIVELVAKIAALEAKLAGSTSAPVHASPAPLEAEPRGSCKVPDCESTVRSKGFCSPHYQQWRRGSLKGFAGPEGHVIGVEGVSQVPSDYAGALVSMSAGKITADGVAI